MSIGNALSNAVSGMTASSRRAEVTSNNIANATTEGYVRQTVTTTHHVVAGRGAGVMVDPVERQTDPRLTASRREADAEAGNNDAVSKAGRALADAVGKTDDPSALFNRMAALETSFRSIAETPESVALHERSVAAAGDVIESFHSIAETIDTIRTDADSDIARGVAKVNAALKEIEYLNSEISAAKVAGFDSAGFEQSRDAALDSVADYLPIRTLPRGTGQVAVLTDKGVSLLDGKARTLEFTATPVVTVGMDHRAGVGPLSGLTVDGVELSPGAGAQSTISGRFAGLFEVRDGMSLNAASELDALAKDLVARFEQPGVAGSDGRGIFTDAGVPLDAVPAPGLAARLTLNERIDTDQGGDPSRLRDGLDAAAPGPAANAVHARALADAMTERRSAGSALSTPASAAGLAGALGSVFETRSQFLEDTAATSSTRRAVLQDAEASVTGVDIDQELKELILIEQAYAANARVIEVADRLVQRLLEI